VVALGKQIGIRVPPALGDRLVRLAARENNRVSAVARRLLTATLDREEALGGAQRAVQTFLRLNTRAAQRYHAARKVTLCDSAAAA